MSNQPPADGFDEPPALSQGAFADLFAEHHVEPPNYVPASVPFIDPPANTAAEPLTDARLYFPDSEGWTAGIQRDHGRTFCFSKQPGEDYFHLIVPGELYVARGDERYCLRCALRKGLLTTDRVFWQNRVKSHKRD